MPDNAALLLWVCRSGHCHIKAFLRIHTNYFHAQFIEGLHDLVALALAQQAVVHEDAVQLCPDSASEQGHHH